MRLHIIYRSAPVENTAPRPSYYSKDACLGSFLSALKAPDLPIGDVLFVNDGAIGDGRVAVMERHGTVLALPGIGNAPSYRAALSIPDWRGWPDNDLVYLVEDDYLHLPDALSQLISAAQAIPQASFFTLYQHPDFLVKRDHLRYRRRTSASAASVGRYRWEPCWGTPLTYAARIGRLRLVAGIHALAARGKHSPDDVTLWKATQGVGVHQLLHAFVRQTPLRDLDALGSAAVEIVTRRSRKRDLLVFPTPTLATHLHEPLVAAGQDWDRVATEGLAALS